jgi:hypothetical protein
MGSTVRVAAQIWSNTGQVIDNLSNNLIALKQSFDSGSTLQAVLVSSRTFEELEKLGLLIALIIYKTLQTNMTNN